MTARSLRRQMDEANERGQSDGMKHDARDPAWFSHGKNGPYLRMAYNAGHEQGRRLRQASQDLADAHSMTIEEASAAFARG